MDAGKEYAGSINDADFYTMDEWKDMPLRKLKSVVVIIKKMAKLMLMLIM